ncbi:Glutathione S-transferase 1 [Trichoplax sp. H2]|nr:Glutathione S-transferase 1 [Trichoplax sp. H2]|eukprot:RDD37714.1 Glutathione S-transferase 1 [Trichoplax sp. H2]
MPSYRLTYFDARGRGEVIRYLFVLADVPYQDVRVTSEEWREIKSGWCCNIFLNIANFAPKNQSSFNLEIECSAKKFNIKAPFGQLPILEVDDKVLCQSDAIAVYLAREFGLAGKTSWDEYRVYVVQGAVNDLIAKLIDIHYYTDEETKKAEKQKDFSENFLPSWLSAVEKVYKEGGTSFFVGDSLTLADLYFFNVCETIQVFSRGSKDIFKSAPALDELFDRIANTPKIKAWREKRPKTHF